MILVFPRAKQDFAIQNMGERGVSFCDHCSQYFQFYLRLFYITSCIKDKKPSSWFHNIQKLVVSFYWKPFAVNSCSFWFQANQERFFRNSSLITYKRHIFQHKDLKKNDLIPLDIPYSLLFAKEITEVDHFFLIFCFICHFYSDYKYV